MGSGRYTVRHARSRFIRVQSPCRRRRPSPAHRGVMKPITTLSALLLALAVPVIAADWPQYRGPDRDGVSKDTGLLQQWPQGGPRLLWTYADTGVGYAGPAVVGDR